tara:strand:+ start:36 stop:218 length:183 start_codon:yes stop_codon:yes gene_type:complete
MTDYYKYVTDENRDVIDVYCSKIEYVKDGALWSPDTLPSVPIKSGSGYYLKIFKKSPHSI